MNVGKIDRTNFTSAYGRLEDGWHDFTKSAKETISEQDVRIAINNAKQKTGVNLSGSAWLQQVNTYLLANFNKGLSLILTDKTACRFNSIAASDEKKLSFINKLYAKRIVFEKLLCKTGQIDNESLRVIL